MPQVNDSNIALCTETLSVSGSRQVAMEFSRPIDQLTMETERRQILTLRLDTVVNATEFTALLQAEAIGTQGIVIKIDKSTSATAGSTM